MASVQLFLKSDKLSVLDIKSDEKIIKIKQRLEKELGFPVDDQILSTCGKILFDHLTIEETGLETNSTIDVCSKLLGGKVHGSLARAGKVKNQTKKVEKKDKNKPKTGRCKQRLKFNRRFKRVVPRMGARKVGPNSNSRK